MRKRKLLNRFRNSDATTEKNAKTINELKIRRRLFFRRLVSHGVIIEVDGRYYLDEQKLTEYNAKRRLIIIPLVILLVIIAILLDIVLT